MKNAALFSMDLTAPRTELHENLKLTSCEVSFNQLPAGAAIPFVHKHQQNEEVYLITKGSGEFWLDGEITAVKAGDALRVDPDCERCLKAGAEGMAYYCIQAKQNSLTQFTMTDAAMCDSKAF